MRWIVLFLFCLSAAGFSSQTQATVAPENKAETLVLDWAKRWSNKNFLGYAELYSPAFRSSEYKDLNSWLRVRERRLANPKQIEVRIYDLRVLQAAATQLDLEFVQYYSSDRLRVYSLKRQTWHLVEGQWRIRLEEAVDLAGSHAVVRQALARPVLASSDVAPKTSSEPSSPTAPQAKDAQDKLSQSPPFRHSWAHRVAKCSYFRLSIRRPAASFFSRGAWSRPKPIPRPEAKPGANAGGCW